MSKQPPDPRGAFGGAAARSGDMTGKWAALHEAAAVVAALAGLEPQGMAANHRNFPIVMRDAGGWRRIMADEGIDDLSAIMQTGIAALLAVHARHADAAVPARALWDEFVAAREALLALTPPGVLERRLVG